MLYAKALVLQPGTARKLSATPIEAGKQAVVAGEGRGPPQVTPVVLSLSLTDAEYLRSAFRAHTLNRRALVLHDDLLWILDLHLLLALHAVSL